MSKHYIFRWKECGICVIPSRSRSEDDCWSWAIINLRPAGMTDDKEAERRLRKNGEVIEDED